MLSSCAPHRGSGAGSLSALRSLSTSAGTVATSSWPHAVQVVTMGGAWSTPSPRSGGFARSGPSGRPRTRRGARRTYSTDAGSPQAHSAVPPASVEVDSTSTLPPRSRMRQPTSPVVPVLVTDTYHSPHPADPG